MNCGLWNRRGGPAAWAVAFVLALLCHGSAWAWGEEGHSIVAEIAQRRLNDRAAAKVAALLGKGVSLASVSTWADDVRVERTDTYNRHFVDIPLAVDAYDAARDCRPAPRGDCVVAEVDRLIATLRSPTATPAQQREALQFLVHFVADLHQPMHTLQEDRGANDVPVRLYVDPRRRERRATNLHAAWDFGLIHVYFYSWGSYVDFLEARWLPGRDAGLLARGSVVDWVNEAHAKARPAYAVQRGADLDNAYIAAAREAIDHALGAGGLRLARLLTEVLGN